MSDSRVYFDEEPESIESVWQHFTRNRTFSPKVWDDAYLAALAVTGNLKVLTFDRGFMEYIQLNCIFLK